jgi:hypothetical protein
MMEMAEMIETYIEHYTDKGGNRYPVHYPTPFVRHYMKERRCAADCGGDRYRTDRAG